MDGAECIPTFGAGEPYQARRVNSVWAESGSGNVGPTATRMSPFTRPRKCHVLEEAAGDWQEVPVRVHECVRERD